MTMSDNKHDLARFLLFLKLVSHSPKKIPICDVLSNLPEVSVQPLVAFHVLTGSDSTSYNVSRSSNIHGVLIFANFTKRTNSRI